MSSTDTINETTEATGPKVQFILSEKGELQEIS